MDTFPQLRPFYSVEEYLHREELSDTKHEYYRGDIFAMTGGSIDHNRIAGNVFAALSEGLRGGPCEAFTGDMRLLVERHTLYCYPDAMVICGEPAFAPGRRDVVTNPTLILEVLSPSTKIYDRGEKFNFYRNIPTFQEYLLVDQSRVYAEQWQRQENGSWLLSEFDRLDQEIAFPSIGITIPVYRLYERVAWLATTNQ
jgi:Uma2 family endonuclease